jgi:propionyl-CoA:succinyl-CoA transferase
MISYSKFSLINAEEAAAHIPSGTVVAFSGFSSAGSPKIVRRAIAQRARRIHEKGEAYRIRVLTGGSTGPSVDEELAASDGISWRAPYRGRSILRGQINRGEVAYIDMHLSHVSQMVARDFL